MTYTAVTAYYRYSSDAQSEGTSIERQTKLANEAAARLGVKVTNTLVDEGKSGFKGEHRQAGGAMFTFEAECRDGLHHGSLLILETLDRLTRQGIDETLDLLRVFNRGGVSVATCDDNELYQAGQPLKMDQAIRALCKSDLARDESAKKSKRGLDTYDIRQRHCRANRLAVTRLVAPWIIVNADRTMKLDAARVDLLNRVFRLADGGMGAKAIAELLNREKVPLWRAREKKQATCWGRTRVTKMLTDRTAIGEFQPTRGGKPNGPVWTDHFPRAIDHALFERVQLGAQARKLASTGNRDEKVSNLFTGLLRCSCCGDRVTYRRGRAAGAQVTTKNGSTYTYRRDNGSLVCYTAGAYGPCSNRKHLAYLTFENTVLTACLHLALDDTAFSRKDEVGRLNVTIAEKERALAVAMETATNLATAWAAKPSDLRRQMADRAEDEAEALQANVEALKAQREDARGRVSSQEHLARVEDVRANLYHEDLTVRVPLRRKVMHALRNVIRSMTLAADGTVTVVMDGGLVAFKVDGKNVTDIGNAIDAIKSGAIPLPRSGNRTVQGEMTRRMKKAKGA